MELSGKIAVITGGASGLGEATVRRFAAAGANIMMLDLADEKGTALAEELGETVRYRRCDVTKEDEVQAAVDEAVSAFGALHICCNFAGVGSAAKTYGKKGVHPLDMFKKVIDINLMGTFNVLRLCAEKMAQNEPLSEDGLRGVIVNTASVAAFDGQMGQAAYSASKGGIVGMTLPIARDLASVGIRCNTIAPGLIHTPLFNAMPPEVIESLSNSVLNPRRLGKPDEIAATAQWIVENDYMNGETVRVDGGIRMQPK